MSRKGAAVVAVSSSSRKLVSGFFFDGVTTGAETRGRLCIFPSFVGGWRCHDGSGNQLVMILPKLHIRQA